MRDSRCGAPTMSNSSYESASPPKTPNATLQTKISTLWPSTTLLLSLLAPVLAAILVYQLDPFDPAPLPIHDLTYLTTHPPLRALMRNGGLLNGSELVGVGQLQAPEDVQYDPMSQLIYTGCRDGWIKRVTLNDSVADMVVENWVNTGGRPLGLALGHNNELIVADADKGLLNVSRDGMVKLLTDEAEGLKFKITDGVDVAKDGVIYFTDASYKYHLKVYIWDILEGKPHGRLMSFHPRTQQTQVLVRDLYFANGVAISPNQHYVIFCETTMRRCRKYYIHGEKKGSVEKFVDHLPGLPDNIRYDGQGHYWIALSTEATKSLDLAFRYPFIRKVLIIMERYIGRPNLEKNGGVLAVDLEGKPVAHYYDPGLSMISSGIKIGNHLYSGSIRYPYIIRLNLTQYPAVATV